MAVAINLFGVVVVVLLLLLVVIFIAYLVCHTFLRGMLEMGGRNQKHY